ncbi:MAG: molecular chaperone [Neisseriaceae bacterium]|nr:molecular chaperone [Neisseriaceae bacterium]MBP6862548.1 molecular chaperone [Neisseriaceae bacterium]
MHRLMAYAGASLLGLSLAPLSTASVTLMGTRQFHYCHQAKQTLTFLGDYLKAPSVLTTWVDKAPHQPLPHKAEAPFMLLPPQFKMQPNTPQKTVLLYTGSAQSCPKTQEAVYYFYFLETPLSTLTQPDTLQYLSMVKLFLRPNHLTHNHQGGGAQLNISLDATQAYLLIHNPSPYHVTISRWQTPSDPKLLAEPVMVAPNSTLRHPLSQAAKVTLGQSITVTALDDFGKPHRSHHRLKRP